MRKLVLWLWLGFFALVGVLLLLHCKMAPTTVRGAVCWTVAWFVIGLAFVGLVYPMYEHAWLGATLAEPSDSPGADASMMFASAYLLEYALAVDSVLLVSQLCILHRVPWSHHRRVVFWGLVGALVARPLILPGVAWLAREATWTLYVFGAFVLVSCVTLLRFDSDEKEVPDSSSAVVQKERMRLTRMLWRWGRLTDRDFSGRFWVIRKGRRVLTMAAACVLSIVLAELVFMFDDATMAVSVSTTTFIVVTSHMLAAIALSSWVLLFSSIQALSCPRYALAGLLGVIGIKLLVQNHVHVPHAALLAVIAGLVVAGVAESAFAHRRARSR